MTRSRYDIYTSIRTFGRRLNVVLLLLCLLSMISNSANGISDNDPAIAAALPPMLECGGIWYLNGIGDQSDVPIANFLPTAPVNASLFNFDPGRDAFPGLVIKKGNGGINETDATKYQVWRMQNPTEPLNGNVGLHIWTAMKDFNTSSGGSFTAYLADCQASGGDCIPLASVVRTRTDWDMANSGTWIEEVINFGNIDHVFLGGRRAAIKIVVNNSSGDDMWFAYNAVPYPSRMVINSSHVPAINCPSDIAVANAPDVCGTVVNYPMPTGSFPCGPTTITQIAGLPSGSFFPTGTTTNTFLITHASGASSQCSFNVTVTDTQAPVLSACPQDIEITLPPGQCDALVEWPAPEANDDCSPVQIVQTAGPLSGSTFQIGTTQISYSITDPSGNGTECAFTVTILDPQEPPVITYCPPDQQLEFDPGTCSAIAEWVEPEAYVACSGVQIVQTQGPTSGSAFSPGITQISYSITDGYGNTSNCSFTITVIDNSFPEFVHCPSDTLVSASLDDCGALVNWDEPVAISLCSQVVLEQIAGPLNGTGVLPLGITEIIYVATNASGNQAFCTFQITVIDDQPPVLFDCPSDTLIPNDPGLCGAIVTWDTPTAIDACSTANIIQSSGPASGSLLLIGTTVIMYTATDASGNSSSCSFSITIEDQEAPVANCVPLELVMQGNQPVAVTPEQINGGSSDNCGIVSMSVEPDVFDTPGEHSVTLTVIDEAGNVATCTSMVQVIQDPAPVAICQDLSIHLNDVGEASITANDIDGGSHATSGIAQLIASLTDFDCSHIGQIEVVLTVIDENGSSAACTSMVTVLDTISPVAQCENIELMLNTADEWISIEAGQIDGGSSDNCGNDLTLDLSNTYFQGQGIQSVELTVIDASGNTSSCISVITITLAPAPTDLVIPAGFSPNGDGISDTWMIQGIENYPGNKLIIFNRWGNELLKVSPYQNDWDGSGAGNSTISGQLPSGVYFYQLDLGEAEQVHTGYIQLNR